MRYRIVATVVVGLAILAAAVAQWSTSSAQEPATTTAVPPSPTATPSPTAYPLQGLRLGLLAHTELIASTDGPAQVSAATLSVQPGQASLPFVSEGETILVVTSGEITVESDDASLQVVDSGALIGLESAAGTPGPIDGQRVTAGWQVHLPAGSTTTIRNESAAAASLIVVTLVPVDASPAGTPTP
jgi:hypothetical protein